MKEYDVYIGLESNQGDRVSHLRGAVRRLSAFVKVTKISQLYVVAPMGSLSDDALVSAVVLGTTTATPVELLGKLQSVEQAMGRSPGEQNGTPLIDLDILFYGAMQIETPKLTIPHARLPERPAVLKPLAELMPNLMHPVLYYTIAELLQDNVDANEVHLYEAMSTPAGARA